MASLAFFLCFLSASVGFSLWGVFASLGIDTSIPRAIALGSIPLLPLLMGLARASDRRKEPALPEIPQRPAIQDFKVGAFPPRQVHNPEAPK